MNFKERGVMVGDLVILLIILFSSFFIFKAVNKENKSSFKNIYPELIFLDTNKIFES